jgi:hypothetical protein
MTASGWLRAFWVLAPVFSAFACDRPGWELSDTAPVAGASTFGGSSAGSEAEPCNIDTPLGASPIFAARTVLHNSPARPVVWAYVSDGEAARLRTDRKLLQAPAPGAAVPAVQTRLTQALNRALPSQTAFLSTVLQRFGTVRPTWPNLFALRLLEHPGSEHMNPVRIVLRENAWIGRLSGDDLTLVDLKNQLVTPDQAKANPERIAAIYVLMAPGVAPSISCEEGFRELSLGNESMVESWSLASDEALTQLDADILALTELFKVARPCTTVGQGGMTFQGSTVCTSWQAFGAFTEYTAYAWSLAKPSELYKPTAQNLNTLVEALERDRFEVDPFVVEPAMSSGGTVGVGGESAAGESAAGESAGGESAGGDSAGGAGGFGGAP